ncbi:hypothetical protein [Verrucomicrobium spinosum]|uniref:hypothetical protein n=1 Tax=Verrucomicrobium spinosum TaxID=2736 RepID=UPI000B29840E|nr:hypothetical protein [Verrucomicrobium spinosum]
MNEADTWHQPPAAHRRWQSPGYKHGQHLAHDSAKSPPLTNLLLSTIQKMGVETSTFQDSNGTLTGVD